MSKSVTGKNITDKYLASPGEFKQDTKVIVKVIAKFIGKEYTFNSVKRVISRVTTISQVLELEKLLALSPFGPYG
jgi:hypothetical protein